jgi:catechol 2,3-dioxygenase-like lactoylglutathione lyase family enzyme
MATQSPHPSFHLATVNIDCADARAMADFYGRLLGWEVTYGNGDFVLMRDPGGGTGLSFQQQEGYRPPVWPERAGEQDKMIHLDIKVKDLDAAVAHALAAGARLAEYQSRSDLRVLLDPAGHPFCLFLK